MKPVRYTRHAKNRMRLHGISEDEVAECLNAFEFEEKSIMGRLNRWKRIRGKFLRITLKEEETQNVIITAVMKRSMKEV